MRKFQPLHFRMSSSAIPESLLANFVNVSGCVICSTLVAFMTNDKGGIGRFYLMNWKHIIDFQSSLSRNFLRNFLTCNQFLQVLVILQIRLKNNGIHHIYHASLKFDSRNLYSIPENN